MSEHNAVGRGAVVPANARRALRLNNPLPRHADTLDLEFSVPALAGACAR